VETEAAEPHDTGAGSLLHVLAFRAATQRMSDLEASAFACGFAIFCNFLDLLCRPDWSPKALSQPHDRLGRTR